MIKSLSAALKNIFVHFNTLNQLARLAVKVIEFKLLFNYNLRKFSSRNQVTMVKTLCLMVLLCVALVIEADMISNPDLDGLVFDAILRNTVSDNSKLLKSKLLKLFSGKFASLAIRNARHRQLG